MPLTDPDQDRVYTGSTTVDRFGPGPRPVPAGTEPVSLPVQIVQGTDSETYSSIKDFGSVKLDGDKTFEASVSFPVDDCPIISPTPELCDGSGGGGSGSENGGSGSGSSGSVASGMSGLLPNTGGGMALWLLGAGALMAGVGFLVRRFAR